jgi:hypothetical protein
LYRATPGDQKKPGAKSEATKAAEQETIRVEFYDVNVSDVKEKKKTIKAAVPAAVSGVNKAAAKELKTSTATVGGLYKNP